MLDISRNQSLYCICRFTDKPDTCGWPVKSLGFLATLGDPELFSAMGIAPTDSVIEQRADRFVGGALVATSKNSILFEQRLGTATDCDGNCWEVLRRSRGRLRQPRAIKHAVSIYLNSKITTRNTIGSRGSMAPPAGTSVSGVFTDSNLSFHKYFVYGASFWRRQLGQLERAWRDI